MEAITLCSVRDAGVAGKRVLLRTSLNVPINEHGEVEDEFRLIQDLKTLRHLVVQGAKVILVGYIGREGGSLKPVVSALSRLATEITFAFYDGPLAGAHGEVEKLRPGQCLMLENIRREPGEEKKDPALAHTLAGLADVFVNDAFAEAHRDYASNVGVAALLPSYAGFLLEEEVARLSEALVPPGDALALIGGAKFETKEPLITKLLGHYRKVLLGGALANDVLKARGLPVGMSHVSDNPVPVDIAGDERVVVPDDLVVLDAAPREAHNADVRAHEKSVDIGKGTAERWAEDIAAADFVLWNGPMGIYEDGYRAGTDALAKALAKAQCRAVIGGGDTAAALSQFSFDPHRIFLSTGGGAMLQFLVDGTLPALEPLRR